MTASSLGKISSQCYIPEQFTKLKDIIHTESKPNTVYPSLLFPGVQSMPVLPQRISQIRDNPMEN